VSRGAVAPVVGVVMGSISDWSVMEHATSILDRMGLAYETRIVSAHRMPVEMATYASTAAERGLRVIIAGAGGAAHLPGMLAAHTWIPVLGVPIPSTVFQGTDSLLSIVQMPAGVPVATFAVGRPGAVNAALFAASMLADRHAALGDAALGDALRAYRQQSHDEAVASELQLP
jgi:5-(carboxyamino)imidazole ribonucleotide mutase